ncbi:MAG: dephospho-CoA kinase [Candidatus Omnitrophota bacterium]|nr:dephospho-CoA kinase [Candidatus Omnitrophota bacterium]
MPRPKRAKGRVILGLTGSFGSGKSTVAAMLKALGAEVIDADMLAHRCLRPGTPSYRRIVKIFGTRILNPNQTVNRKKLAAIVFSSQGLLSKLNSIIHPGVISSIKEKIRRAKAKILVLDVPLLIEAGLTPLIDKLIVVDLNQGAQVQRLRKKFKLKKSEILKRIAFQAPMREKIRLADFIIDNNGTIAQTKRQVKNIWEEIKWRN